MSWPGAGGTRRLDGTTGSVFPTYDCCPATDFSRTRFGGGRANHLPGLGDKRGDAVGRTAILSFLLPGDIASTALIFKPISQCSVEAITDVHYRTFKRAEFKEALLKHPDLSDKLFNIWIDEKARADQLAVDLDQRAADERVANLILNLFDRLTGRGIARDQTMDFPLRQHHIADATGLTAIHVNRVMSAFRRAGLLETNERSLTILDLTGLRRITNLR